jgi:hypothetical protein
MVTVTEYSDGVQCSVVRYSDEYSDEFSDELQ